MSEIHDEVVVFHKVPMAKAVLTQAGTLSVHDVYTMPSDEAISDWGLYAKKGNGFIRLYATKETGKRGVKVYRYYLPFDTLASPLGYLKLPEGWRWE